MLKSIPSSGRRLLAALCLCLLASAVVASAASRFVGPLLNVSLDGSITRGSQTLTLAEMVRPGDTLNWRMVIANRGDGPSPSVWSVDGQVDPKTVYVMGSGSCDGSPAVSYSLDGENFSARPVETYMEAGVQKQRPAPVEAYRAVRFTWSDSINAGEVRACRYQARVR
jgi:hypothetical protein